MKDELESSKGFLPGAKRDKQSITSDWHLLQELIDGVKIREVRNVLTKNGGILTEVFRSDWGLQENHVDQVFQRSLEPNGISGWHMHGFTTDRLFVNWGLLKIVLYDARSNSTTFGLINEFCFGSVLPALLIVPPGVWHGVQNLRNETSALLNLVDKAYQYEDPDHWRLPIDTDKIPYRFELG
ncbi:dTDP-4-dehydrorhamnose 3,5-epimerase family protein [bacterium]|nr:dTDP-4-dehydrorhamnose 3,5-epimerase family protein [bacterium]MCI0601967.1 dTDP-4-dehydrorhamnose 3,5-epimerase family protein [bacterium]